MRLAVELRFTGDGFTLCGERLVRAAQLPDVGGKDVEVVYTCADKDLRAALRDLREVAMHLAVHGGARSVQFVRSEYVPRTPPVEMDPEPRDVLSVWHWEVVDEDAKSVVLRLGFQPPVRFPRSRLETIAQDVALVAERAALPELFGPPVRVDVACFRVAIGGVYIFAAPEHLTELATLLVDLAAFAEREARCA
jgi:hypothetical protein